MGNSLPYFEELFPLHIGSCLEEGALIAVRQNDFQNRPIWISVRDLFQGYVVCPESGGLWFHFPGNWWASTSQLYLSWTLRQVEKQMHSEPLLRGA